MTNENITNGAPPSASFLGIPIELRLRIYEIAFRNDEVLIKLQGRSDGQTYISKAVTGPLALSRVSRAVAREIKTILPPICDIHFSLENFNHEDLTGWLRYMGQEQVARIQKLSIDCYGGCEEIRGLGNDGHYSYCNYHRRSDRVCSEYCRSFQRTLLEAKKSYGLCRRSITIDLHKFDVKNGTGLNALRQCFVADTCHGTFAGSSWDRETTKCGINYLRRTMDSILNPDTGSASLDRTKLSRIMGAMLHDYSSNRAQKNWDLFVRKGMALHLAEQERQGTSIVASRGNRQHASVDAAEPFLVPEPRVVTLTEEDLAQYDSLDSADSKLEAHAAKTEAKQRVMVSVREDDLLNDENLEDSNSHTSTSEHDGAARSRISKAFGFRRLINWLRPT